MLLKDAPIPLLFLKAEPIPLLFMMDAEYFPLLFMMIAEYFPIWVPPKLDAPKGVAKWPTARPVRRQHPGRCLS